MLKRKLWPILVVGILALGHFSGLASNLSAQDDPAIDYVPGSAFAMVTAKPKAILALPGMDLLPIEVIKVFGSKELGLDLLELERVIVIVDPFEEDQRDPPEAGAIFRFATPQKLGGRMTADLEPVTINGREGFELGPDGAVLSIDEKTIIVGTGAYLKRMVNAKGASSDLISALKAERESDNVTAFVAIDPIREMIKSNLPTVDEVPPPFRKFLELPDMIKYVGYRSSFAANGKEQILIGATSDSAAEEIVTLVEEGIDMGKQAAIAWLTNVSGIAEDDYLDAIVQYAERATKFIKAAVHPEVSGSELVYTIQGQGGMGAVATTGTLIGMLLPAVQQVREAARRTHAMNTLRQFVLASLNYESALGHFPSQGSYSEDGKPLLSWRVHVLPYLEENKLYEQFHLDEPWDSDHNIQLLDQMPTIFESPNLGDLGGKTVFLAISGEGTVFHKDQKTKFSDIADGSSNTVLFVEADESEAVNWTEPTDWQFDKDDPMHGLGGLRPGGFNAAFCDGSTRFISNSVDESIWAAICTMAGGEIVSDNDFNRRP